jgi:hypothetical protein
MMRGKTRRGKQLTPELISSDTVAGPRAEAEQALPTAMEWLPTSAVDNGTQAVLHDDYDVQLYNEALHSYSRLPETLQKVQERLSTAPALIRDVFNSV